MRCTIRISQVYGVFEHVNVRTNDTVFVGGDVNFPSVHWTRDTTNDRSFLPVNVLSDIEENVFHTLLENDLSQLNNIRNTNGRLVELLFSNCVDDVSVIECPHPRVKFDLQPFSIEFTLNVSMVEVITPAPVVDAVNF